MPLAHKHDSARRQDDGYRPRGPDTGEYHANERSADNADAEDDSLNATYDTHFNPDRVKNDAWTSGGRQGYNGSTWRQDMAVYVQDGQASNQAMNGMQAMNPNVVMMQPIVMSMSPMQAMNPQMGQMMFVADYSQVAQAGQKMSLTPEAAKERGETRSKEARTRRKIVNKSVPLVENPGAGKPISPASPTLAVSLSKQAPTREETEEQEQHIHPEQQATEEEEYPPIHSPNPRHKVRLMNKALGRGAVDSGDPFFAGVQETAYLGSRGQSSASQSSKSHRVQSDVHRNHASNAPSAGSRALPNYSSRESARARPPDRISARELLAFRECAHEVPRVMLGLRAGLLELPKHREMSKVDAQRGGSWSTKVRMGKESRKQSKSKAPVAPRKPCSALRPTISGDADEEIKRNVKSLLNKMCPENFYVLTEKLASLELKTASQLTIVIDCVFTKAVTEHTYCEMYSDLCMALRPRYPSFPGEDGEPEYTFTRALLNRCQEEFDNLPHNFEDGTQDGQSDHAVKKSKERVLGNMKFIGQLFLRRLLSNKVVREVVVQLVFREDKPMDHYIECLCILLRNVGASLESTTTGAEYSTLFMDRLKCLIALDYTKRIKFTMQAVIELQENHWEERVLHEKAKTKEEIRRDQLFEDRRRSSGVHNPFAVTEIAGQRPSYIRSPTM